MISSHTAICPSLIWHEWACHQPLKILPSDELVQSAGRAGAQLQKALGQAVKKSTSISLQDEPPCAAAAAPTEVSSSDSAADSQRDRHSASGWLTGAAGQLAASQIAPAEDPQQTAADAAAAANAVAAGDHLWCTLSEAGADT